MASPTDLGSVAEVVKPQLPAEPLEPLLQLQVAEPLLQPDNADAVYREIIRTTHQCVLYGSAGFAVLCILIGAVEALFGR